MKKKMARKIFESIIIILDVFVMTFSSLIYGASTKTTICDSMALAFDRYLKTTHQTFVAAQFKSDDPRDPIRRKEFEEVNVFQNLWQLKKGPDNSLIRVMGPANLPSTNSLVYPLTLYPEFSTTDDSNEIKPIVYSGYDQDFKGDYLDIKIKQFNDCDLQINWSDFYRDGKLENYKSDTHSIMVSETVAKEIFSARYNVDVSSIKDEELSVLLGTTIRCKMIKETGTVEAPEREKNKPIDEQDPTIINSPYYSEEACRVKKIIGILDNKSAEKYFPLIGNDFVFAVPNTYVSYDYFHPIVYGMFKNNFVGNKTSLKYFMAFSDFAEKNEDYDLNFCNIENNVLNTEGSLQKNYKNCLKFYSENDNYLVSLISSLISFLSFGTLICYLLIYFFKFKNRYKKNNLFSLICLLSLFLLFSFVFSMVKGLTIFNFILPMLNVPGFILLFIFEIILSLLLILLGKERNLRDKYNKLVVACNDNIAIVSKKRSLFKSFLSNSIAGAVLSFTVYLLLNVALLKTGITSIGLPFISAFIGAVFAIFINKYLIICNNKVDKNLLLKNVLCNIFEGVGVIIGAGIGVVLTKFNFIWIEGISLSIKILVSTVVLSIFTNIVVFWCVLLYRKIRNNFIKNNLANSKEKLNNYESISI